MENLILLDHLEKLLGKSRKTSKDNYAFTCPFNPHGQCVGPGKKKLEIKLTTDSHGHNPWECWVCKTRGRTIKSLLYNLKVDKIKANSILGSIRKDLTMGDYDFNLETLELPKEFRPLSDFNENSRVARRYLRYLKVDRGLTDQDILKYNIGVCFSGDYQDRIIFPSYDKDNNLNYFIARSLYTKGMRYKGPSVSKDAIYYENTINWNLPIYVVEGFLDAITVKRNAIPVAGKVIPNSLKHKLITCSTKTIYIALDPDAFQDALDYCELLMNEGKDVYLIDLKEGDPSELGYKKFHEKALNTEKLTLKKLLAYKLDSI